MVLYYYYLGFLYIIYLSNIYYSAYLKPNDNFFLFKNNASSDKKITHVGNMNSYHYNNICRFQVIILCPSLFFKSINTDYMYKQQRKIAVFDKVNVYFFL